MPRWIAVVLRWAIAVGLAVWAFVALGPIVLDELGSAIGVDQDEEELPEVGQAVGPPPLEAGSVEAVAAVGSSLGTVESLDADLVAIGPAELDTLLLGFDPVEFDPACMAGVALEVRLHDSDETNVYALPARVDDLHALEDGQGLPANLLLDRSDPATAFTSGSAGWLRFDVTGAYQLAARAAAADAPLVLALQLPEDADSDVATQFALGDEHLPRLRWAAIAGCDPPDDDRSGGDETDDDADGEGAEA